MSEWVYADMSALTCRKCLLSQDLITMKVSSGQQGTAGRLASNKAQDLCGCGLQANSSLIQLATAGAAEDSCSYLAWQLLVLPGQNKFDVAFTMVSATSSMSQWEFEPSPCMATEV